MAGEYAPRRLLCSSEVRGDAVVLWVGERACSGGEDWYGAKSILERGDGTWFAMCFGDVVACF